MISKSLILLLSLTTEISGGSLWGKPTIPKKIELTEEILKTIKDSVSKFIDFVTLQETETLWKQPNFPNCLNSESTDYNIAIHLARQQIKGQLQKYHDNSRVGVEDFIKETEGYAENLCDLIDKVRSQIYLKTYAPDFDENELKSFIKKVKGLIENNFIYIYQNLFTIKKRNQSNFQEQHWEEAKKIIVEEMKKIKEESIKFTNSIKKCLGN